MTQLNDKHILLGITGGIAAYKCIELVRRLRDHGAHVRVAMTPAATEFITPLTFQAVSGNRVQTTLLDVDAEAAMGHIELARWADMIVIAPATADFIARLAHGHANDLLSTLCLATAAPICIAPAMNQQMWKAPAVQANCQQVREFGIQIWGPAVGSQACGDVGAGRMLEPAELLQRIQSAFGPLRGKLSGKRVLVTAGPTREDLDPVRFISNRSSGRMGYAVAEAARDAGAEVFLVSGPVNLAAPLGVQLIPAYSAQQMLDAVMAKVQDCDIFISAAAVADYRTAEMATQKIKKKSDEMLIELAKTTDIIAQVAALPKPPFTVGFAAETQAVAAYARDKLERKKLDMIAANLVGVEGTGFDSLENALTVLWKEGEVELARNTKTVLAQQLLELIIARFQVV
ncbi:MAG: bifunctional phosphopantothenoylcysteine decarboxylase/phosphopantothenate--cysteine ligase CoaBC [Thiotrichaceae bacterium]|nr:bifunctional phosphopantothenoylcysteine decarboxylase/phosphopantothenate--cysteine ligase CoaBC [Thiotrichaceae bacterium]